MDVREGERPRDLEHLRESVWIRAREDAGSPWVGWGLLFKVALDDSFDVRQFCQTPQDAAIVPSGSADAQTLLLARAYSPGRTRHKLDGSINGLNLRLAWVGVRYGEFVRYGDLAVGRAAQPVFVELPQIEFDFPCRVSRSATRNACARCAHEEHPKE